MRQLHINISGKNWPAILVAILFIINIGLLINRFWISSAHKTPASARKGPMRATALSEIPFSYNSPAPDFILGKHDAQSIDKLVKLASPIIEDDGSISGRFGTNVSDTIIIGKNFRLKFKNSIQDYRLIFSQLQELGLAEREEHSFSRTLFSRPLCEILFQDMRPGKNLALNLRRFTHEEMGNCLSGRLFNAL